ncbi:hypothetical protein [Pseudomonas ogarae]|uniref:hypothetical protein n=1 Tax=Pseudomonas ogarae (strain DSM 112162 / CECT 30235 / F113) TaxID=1114970 RepID=UPI0019503ADE|nr:hypothetical protein [Pseudomonas ogarae]
MENLVCDSCRSVFDYSGPAYKYAQYVIDNLPCEKVCDCEALRTTQFSPEPIACEENIVSCTCLPQHWDAAAQKLTHMAAENAFTQGLSVTRMKFAQGGMESVMKSCKGFTNKPKKNESPLGVATFTAGSARAIKLISGERGYFVFDTARAKSVAHGDVIATKYFGDFANLPTVDRLHRTILQTALTICMTHVRH